MSIDDRIPEDCYIQLIGPICKAWSCKLMDYEDNVILIKYGDNAQEAIEICISEFEIAMDKMKPQIEAEAIRLNALGKWKGRRSAIKIAANLKSPSITEVLRIAQVAISK